MHEFAFQVIGQVSHRLKYFIAAFIDMLSQVTGILRHEMMDFMFADPLMLDDLDYLFKCDVARKLMFYHQPKYKPPPPVDKSKENILSSVAK